MTSDSEHCIQFLSSNVVILALRTFQNVMHARDGFQSTHRRVSRCNSIYPSPIRFRQCRLQREREKEREGINLHAAECRWQHTVIAVAAVYPFKCRRSRGLVTVSLNFAWAMDLVWLWISEDSSISKLHKDYNIHKITMLISFILFRFSENQRQLCRVQGLQIGLADDDDDDSVQISRGGKERAAILWANRCRAIVQPSTEACGYSDIWLQWHFMTLEKDLFLMIIFW